MSKNKELVDQILKEITPPVINSPYEWQTMDTAPKDGFAVDLWVTARCFKREQSYRATTAYWSKPESAWVYASGYPIEEQGERVTHWIRIGNPMKEEADVCNNVFRTTDGEE